MKGVAAKLKVMIAAEKKKAITLGALVLMLLVFALKAVWSMGPRIGSASGGAEDASVSSVASAGRDALSRARASAQGGSSGEMVEVPRRRAADRNVFALDPSHFPLLSQPDAPSSSEASNVPEEVEPSAPIADDTRPDREAQLIGQTTGWRLSSVLLGSKPSAVMEAGGPKERKSIVRVGDEFKGWSVIEIAADAVVLEYDGVRVRIMKSSQER